MATLEEELAELATLTASQNAVAMMIRAKSGDEALLRSVQCGLVRGLVEILEARVSQ